MDRTTATKLIATLISATQSGRLSWRKQLPEEIVDKDHAVSAVYFTSINDTGFRIYRYKWERGDYYAVFGSYLREQLQPLRRRGVILEVVDDDGDLVESIQDISALRDLFDVVNQHVSNIREKIERILDYSESAGEQQPTLSAEGQE